MRLVFMFTWNQVFSSPFRLWNLRWVKNSILVFVIIIFFLEPVKKWEAIAHLLGYIFYNYIKSIKKMFLIDESFNGAIN